MRWLEGWWRVGTRVAAVLVTDVVRGAGRARRRSPRIAWSRLAIRTSESQIPASRPGSASRICLAAFTIATAAASTRAAASPGQMAPTWGSNGVVELADIAFIARMAAQPDGSVVL